MDMGDQRNETITPKLRVFIVDWSLCAFSLYANLKASCDMLYAPCYCDRCKILPFCFVP